MKEGKGNKSVPVLSLSRRIHNWIKAGDPPPKTQIKSLYLMLFLLFFGFSTLIVWGLAFFDIKFSDDFQNLGVLFFVAAITLIPGLYAAYVSFCSWRRVYGYDWYMIPNFD